MHLLLIEVRDRERRVRLVENNTSHKARKVQETTTSFLEVGNQSRKRHHPHKFSLLRPLIGLSFYAERSLIVKALVITLEDATMPETLVGFKPWSHVFVVGLNVLFL